jgi:hypothetical protein
MAQGLGKEENMLNRFVAFCVAGLFILGAGLFGSMLIGFTGFLLDLNLGLGSAIASTGPERLKMIGLAILWMVGVGVFSWMARAAIHKAVRREKFFTTADKALAVVIFVATVVIFSFGKA